MLAQRCNSCGLVRGLGFGKGGGEQGGDLRLAALSGEDVGAQGEGLDFGGVLVDKAGGGCVDELSRGWTRSQLDEAAAGVR